MGQMNFPVKAMSCIMYAYVDVEIVFNPGILALFASLKQVLTSSEMVLDTIIVTSQTYKS